ncbi:unnamed protein product [Leptidea sinapis]|uniref:MD-2-related lipid-recognition domain-containing protein n=1 Tax=Leptidea sinapis TaxID=189913 RepID=A0A5E4Q2S5_9NEOP|nr:unnamed protein product [Leptidea sinapis]
MFNVCLLLCFVYVIRASVIFEDCGSAYDLVTVNIQGCDRLMPCFVTLGEKIPVNVRFYADFASRDLDQDVVIKLNFVDSRTPVTPEPCDILFCPVQTDAITSFTSNQRGYLQWRVYNESGLLVLCYSVLVQTQNYLQKLMRQKMATNNKMYKGRPSHTRDLFNFPNATFEFYA